MNFLSFFLYFWLNSLFAKDTLASTINGYTRVGGQGLCAPADAVGSGYLGDVRGKVKSKQQCFDLCSVRSECIGISINGNDCELEARNHKALVAQGIPNMSSCEQNSSPGCGGSFVDWTTYEGSCQTNCIIAGITSMTDTDRDYEC